MQLKEYQQVMKRTMQNQTRMEALSNFALGLAGEAGEVIDPIKKDLFHGKPFTDDYMKKEIGDCIWYLSAIANTLGYDLEEILDINVAKLAARHPNGFVKG